MGPRKLLKSGRRDSQGPPQGGLGSRSATVPAGLPEPLGKSLGNRRSHIRSRDHRQPSDAPRRRCRAAARESWAGSPATPPKGPREPFDELTTRRSNRVSEHLSTASQPTLEDVFQPLPTTSRSTSPKGLPAGPQRAPTRPSKSVSQRPLSDLSHDLEEGLPGPFGGLPRLLRRVSLDFSAGSSADFLRGLPEPFVSSPTSPREGLAAALNDPTHHPTRSPRRPQRPSAPTPK
jgi:hypothetical protein